MQDLSGQRIKGYELHDMIGAGGFGAVYRAFQPLIKRDVAIKIVLPEYANHPEFIRRFEFEAQLVARLEHIHIVPLYDYWREPDGAYLIMRWLKGGSLRGMLRHGPLDSATAVRVVEQVASALGTAHRRGVVHRDIKPDNILFDDEGNAYLADFGIAKDLREAKLEDKESLEEGALTGSPFYLSPEQAQNLPITPQTDLYSLGIVLYEMLVGQPPFLSDQGLIAILVKHIQDPVPSVLKVRPDLPAAVDSVIQRATAKEPASRYADANGLAVDFRRALLGDGGAASGARPVISVGEDGGLEDILVITKPIAASTLLIVPGAEITNPYKGLQPFQEADAGDFFGRTMLVEKLIERLQESGDISRFLAVIGPSGSGKSSVVKAGLVPALRKGALPNSDRWYVATMVPASDPFRELADALLGVAVDPPENLLEKLRTDKETLAEVVDQILPPEPESGLVLVIDQFEEVFTMLDDEAARAHFLDMLLQVIATPDSRFRLIITLRADFYDRPLLYPGFGELVRRRNEVVLPLSTDEMREAIVGPAEQVGLSVESGLVAAIIAEIAEQPGALPLMQYALTELFERRDNNVLTLAAYHASGGVLGALARRAEELYQQTDPEGQEAMRQIALRLVNLGEGTDDTRRRALQHELMALVEDEQVVNRVIDSLGRYRLLTFDHDPDTRAPTVSVAHEALIREWKRLRGWLDESREDILLQRRLAAAKEEWQQQHDDPSFLASGMRLQQFESLLERGTIALTPEEIDYVRASVRQREAREVEERARQAREAMLEKRAKDRMRALAVVMAVAAAVGLFLAALAYVNYRNAESERKNAERSAEVSESLALASSAQTQLVSHNTDLALALALSANQIPDPPIESQLILAQAALNPGTRRVLVGHEGPVFAVAFSPDGKTAVSGSFDNTVRLWDVETGEIIRTMGPDNPDTADVVEGHSSWIRTIAFSRDGKTVLSGARDNTMILWDIETGQVIRQYGPDNPDTTDVVEGHTKSVRAVVYHPDGKRLLSASEDYTMILWDMETGEIIRQFTGHEERIRGADISPDGKTAVSACYDMTLKLWDLETGEVLHTFTGHAAQVTTVAFSPDGTKILSGSADRTVRLWDVATGDELLRMQGHGTWVKSVMFSADGRQALSASDDGTVRLWSLETGDELAQFVGHSDFIEQAVFSPDNYRVLSASGDLTLRLWDLTNGAEVRRLRGHSAGVVNLAISPDGKTALTGAFDSKVLIWNLETGEQIGEFAEHSGFVAPLVFSPDGRTVVSSDSSGADNKTPDDDVILLWDVTTGEVLKRFTGHLDWVQSAEFSADGQTFVTGGKDNKAILWDVETGEAIRTFVRADDDPEQQFWVNGVAFSPDGQTLLTATQDNLLILWNVETGEEIRRYEGHDATVNRAVFNADGTQILSASDDTTMILWDTETGAILHRFQGHTASVQRALFSPDGTLIASASYDGTIRLWDIASGQYIRQLDNGAAVWSLAYLPDGQHLLSGSEDTTVRLWDAAPLALDRLLEWTRNSRYVTELTCLQREQFRVEPKCDAEGNLPVAAP